jgi:N-acetylglucosaminyldiphosphoundecaprenol N-acetyl-beta-D-mannosaminyltransferase
MLETMKVLNVSITNETEKKVLEYLYNRIKNGSEKTFIITPNPEMLVYANNHLAYRDKLNTADIALPDGIGLFFASGVLGDPLQERIAGVDFLKKLCKEAKENPLSMGFLGGKDGVAKHAAERLLGKYPWLDIVFVNPEWNEKGFDWQDKNKTKQNKIKQEANSVIRPRSTMIDILFVAYGIPKQEEWIYDYLPKLPIKAAIGVGGAFDYLSGTVHRAPFIIRFFGFEWLFRLIVQPWRFKRQLALLTFVSLVFKEKFSKKS